MNSSPGQKSKRENRTVDGTRGTSAFEKWVGWSSREKGERQESGGPGSRGRRVFQEENSQ